MAGGVTYIGRLLLHLGAAHRVCLCVRRRIRWPPMRPLARPPLRGGAAGGLICSCKSSDALKHNLTHPINFIVQQYYIHIKLFNAFHIYNCNIF